MAPNPVATLNKGLAEFSIKKLKLALARTSQRISFPSPTRSLAVHDAETKTFFGLRIWEGNQSTQEKTNIMFLNGSLPSLNSLKK